MASKTYAAQEMRDVAECLHYNSPTKLTIKAAAMLRQAADMMEREKRYEYAVMYTALNGRGCISAVRAHCIAASKNILSLYKDENANIVRREVGEWEEVRDGE